MSIGGRLVVSSVFLSYTPVGGRWCLYTASLAVVMGVNGSILSFRLWQTVNTERS